MENYNKEEILNNFSRSVDSYTDHAKAQKEVALRLANALEPWRYSIPDGQCVEIGCGTGIFTDHLLKMISGRELKITDATDEMISHTSSKFNQSDNVHFEKLDAELYKWDSETYALIAGNFVAQWFKHPAMTLSKMAEALVPGGFMLMSLPGSESFPQWKKYCVDLGLPFTANRLPDIEQLIVNLSMGPFKVDFYEDQSTVTFKDLYSFYGHLKKTGCNTQFKKRSLSQKQLKLLNNHWLEKNQGSVNVHIHTAFVAVKRDL